jgi:hypothetical protein
MSPTKVLYSFGREDELDRPAVQRLLAALSRLLDPAAAAAASLPDQMTLTDARPMGGAYALDGLWRRLGIDTVIREALAGTRTDTTRVERILFALVANRALKPSSKLSATDWIAHDVHINGLAEVVDEACYRAMDALLGAEQTVARQVFGQVADLLNLEVDLLFFDTTSTYFQTAEADELVARDESGRVRPTLSAEDIALGYKQLLQVERGWRDMKSVLDLRPVYHHLEDRIRAHVLLRWLALLLARVAETATGRTWPAIRADLDRLHTITFTGPAGTFRQTTELTKVQRDLLAALKLDRPKKIIELATSL